MAARRKLKLTRSLSKADARETLDSNHISLCPPRNDAPTSTRLRLCDVSPLRGIDQRLKADGTAICADQRNAIFTRASPEPRREGGRLWPKCWYVQRLLRTRDGHRGLYQTDARFEVLGSTFSLLSASISPSQNLYTRKGTLLGFNGKPENVRRRYTYTGMKNYTHPGRRLSPRFLSSSPSAVPSSAYPSSTSEQPPPHHTRLSLAPSHQLARSWWFISTVG